MNAEHLRAFLWLRWRLLAHQLRRAGAANTVFLILLIVAGVLFALGLFIAFFLIGLFALDKSSPAVVLFVWDALVMGFLFSWTIGLITELQRSELLSLEKFLHLPVSPAGVFFINYLSSLLSINLVLFAPAMVGLSVALAAARGPRMLLLLPLLAAFLLMVTALTYQFQGWLAALMDNPRKRRTIIVAVTLSFIVICQLPNLFNLLQPFKEQRQDSFAAALDIKDAQLRRSRDEGKLTREQYQRRHEKLRQEYDAHTAKRTSQEIQRLGDSAGLVNLILPPGWLPLGAMGLAQGQMLPALLGTLGLGLIGAASLWRAYRTTLRLYTGQFRGGKRARAAPAPSTAAFKGSSHLLERKIPGLSEHASAIAVAGMRSLLRAPETKLMLLGPVILAVLMVAMTWNRPGGQVSPGLRPLVLFGVLMTLLLTMTQLAGNQFGFDRGGFRVFVLCPAARREILLGKNVALAPLALGLGLALIGAMQAACPLPIADLLATVPQLLSMYLLYCLLTNCLSILTPMAIAPGSLKPIQFTIIPVLLQMALLFVLPLVLVPTLLPLLVAHVVEALGWLPGLVVGPLLSLLECIAIVFLYRFVLRWQGVRLESCEQRILAVVASKAE